MKSHSSKFYYLKKEYYDKYKKRYNLLCIVISIGKNIATNLTNMIKVSEIYSVMKIRVRFIVLWAMDFGSKFSGQRNFHTLILLVTFTFEFIIFLLLISNYLSIYPIPHLSIYQFLSLAFSLNICVRVCVFVYVYMHGLCVFCGYAWICM